MIKELVIKNRSCRRFYEEKEISEKVLKELVDLTRYTPSAGNLQPLKYKLVCHKADNEKVFSCLKWAAYYKDWDGPCEGERPSAYVIMLSKIGVNSERDEGICGQTILLGAVEQGLSGCMIANIDRHKLKQLLNLPEEYECRLVIALGVRKEQAVIDEVGRNDDLKYYRDDAMIQHVPKRKLSEILLT